MNVAYRIFTLGSPQLALFVIYAYCRILSNGHDVYNPRFQQSHTSTRIISWAPLVPWYWSIGFSVVTLVVVSVLPFLLTPSYRDRQEWLLWSLPTGVLVLFAVLHSGLFGTLGAFRLATASKITDLDQLAILGVSLGLLIATYRPQIYRRTRSTPHKQQQSTLANLQEAIATQDIDAVTAALEEEWISIVQDDEFSWLDELSDLGYSPREISEAIIEAKSDCPWICFDQPNLTRKHIDVSHHELNCAHQLSRDRADKESNAGVPLMEENLERITLHHETIQQMVAKVCGLAGITPDPDPLSEWGHAVSFSDDKTSVDIGLKLNDTFDDSSTVSNAKKIKRVIDRLVQLCGWLQENSLCCNSFTFIILRRGSAVVEAIAIPFTRLTNLQEALALLIAEPHDPRRRAVALDAALDILELIRDRGILFREWESALSAEIHMRTESYVEELLCRCALAAQVLCLGMLARSQAHIGKLQPFFLKEGLQKVRLTGTTSSTRKSEFCLQLVRLTCIGDMLGDSVLAFASEHENTQDQKYDLRISPEDLVDIWGPGTFIVDRSATDSYNLCAVEIGHGLVQPFGDSQTILHWEKGSFVDTRHRFSHKNKILIGGRATQNVRCPVDHALDSVESDRSMSYLGTLRDRWEQTEKQLTSQAGYYLSAGANVTWARKKGVTLKDIKRALGHDKLNIAFLDAPWGIQFSLCTGVAQRVPLRVLVADAMVAMVEADLPVPQEWRSLKQDHDVVANFRRADFRVWVKELPIEMQSALAKIVCSILTALHNTGFDGTSKDLIVACPLMSDPSRCFRVACKDDHIWARVLQDSVDCATFAVVTTNCLETRDRKCRGVNGVTWTGATAVLATAVSQYEEVRSDEWQTVVREPEQGAKCWFGEPSANLVAQWVRPYPAIAVAVPAETHLEIFQSSAPPRVTKFLRLKKVRKLQERQTVAEASAREVLIHDRVQHKLQKK